ncbi:MAG: pyrimidine dimer DNA glycosylase [Candidatus Omnitrophota bacterium]|nr:MAG: pyrimidine dimer DNA glycosylase [Candidatus Omnitrophota bacterium]
MRIWDISPAKLCRNHLLGEHRELHAIWSVLTKKKKGYSRHPETLRWHGKLKALFLRHKKLVAEMKRRGYCHKSALEAKLATGSYKQYRYITNPVQQLKILKNKKCNCKT